MYHTIIDISISFLQTQFKVILKSIQSFYKSKIISSVDDKVGLIFYNVVSKKKTINKDVFLSKTCFTHLNRNNRRMTWAFQDAQQYMNQIPHQQKISRESLNQVNCLLNSIFIMVSNIFYWLTYFKDENFERNFGYADA